MKGLIQVLKEDLHEAFDRCLPKDYHPGKKYGRDELVRMFVCYTGKPKKFPIKAVKEWLFPLLPGGGFFMQDPMRMLREYTSPFTLKKMAQVENKNTRNVSIGVKSIASMSFPFQSKRWFSLKRSSPGFQKRFDYQINKIRNNNYDTLIVTPEHEPLVFESIGGQLYIQEGWHRLMAIMELIDNGEITLDQARVYAVVVYRNPGYKLNIKEKPL